MFLRFLIAKGRCAPALEHAIPPIARWRLSSLPKYLPAQDVERLINSCDPSSPMGARDRAIMLLIARLGLRAGDVSALKFGDLLWEEGVLTVSGKKPARSMLAAFPGSRRGDLALSEVWPAVEGEPLYFRHDHSALRPDFSSGGGADRCSRHTPYRDQRTLPRRSSSAAFGSNLHAT